VRVYYLTPCVLYFKYPPPFSPFYFFLNWGLVGLLLELFVGNLLRPSDVEDTPETVVNEYLEFVRSRLLYLPWKRSRQSWRIRQRC
jgi:hypothetical protein